ncbi:Late expression factor 2 [Trabala vishnou gigantina nucleopolyhedrovirus]|uniref:Late expression factor 2 n=1 Tax=Trabala vishnou gigantina nucleopolyhedrovirus TaxID=2863583 RepID=UPI002481D848|nr:Late expression factor 2 [Trabala vishnou gigantina nucleopolyhedrovirus]QYC92733.1 Late expression factor 2 [Trabala vishnou gigantina nucleopolyhedrovirus]
MSSAIAAAAAAAAAEEPLALLVWRPLLECKDVDKNKQYLVPFDEFNLDLSAYTIFHEDNKSVIVSGLRLYYLIKNRNKTIVETNKGGGVVVDSKYKKKNCRNVCFLSVQDNKKNVVMLLKSSLKMPPCMDKLLKSIEQSPRGNRFKKRFVFNCYIINLITCTKCDRACLKEALSQLYNHDSKCVYELNSLVDRSERAYKPPNCINMNKSGMCFKSHQCNGINPLCNN